LGYFLLKKREERKIKRRRKEKEPQFSKVPKMREVTLCKGAL